MKIIILIFVISFSIVSCNKNNRRSDPKEGLYISNFEDEIHWSEASRLEFGQGRDGSVCTSVNSNHEYTETFRLPVKMLKIKSPKKITVEAWAKVSDLKSIAVLVASVKVGTQDIVWTGIDTDQKIIKPNVWTKLEIQADIPKNMDTSAIIMAYGYRKTDGEVLFDDFIIKVE